MTENDYLFVTGRLVQGDVFTPQTKNMTGGPLTDLKGNPKVQYFIGVAVPKTDQVMLASYAKMQAIAQAGFPGGESQRADFAWKVVDGDDPKHASKIGFPGCFIFRFTSGFLVKAWTKGGAQQLMESSQIKRGYHIRVAFNAKSNGNLQKPGLYLNHALIELIGYADEIASGPDAAAVLAQAGEAPLPAGASATPVASGPPLTPGAPTLPGTTPPNAVPGAMPVNPVTPGAPGVNPPVNPGAPGAPGQVPVQNAAPASAPAGSITPAPDFLNPPAGGAAPVMTAKAAGATYQQFIEKGWKHDDLVAQGYVQA